MFKHVLVPIDGSRFSERALDYATGLLSGSEGEISLVVVVPNYLASTFSASKLPGAEELENHHKHLAEEYVSGKAAGVTSSSGVQAKGVALKGSPAEEINRYAAMTRADLIVISSRGISPSGAKDGARMGSVALGVMSSATCPVLLLRATV